VCIDARLGFQKDRPFYGKFIQIITGLMGWLSSLLSVNINEI
jgi:hypothetical protein